MSSKFKKGQRVSFIDEAVCGIIVAIDGSLISLKTDDGFEFQALDTEIIPEKDLDFDLDEGFFDLKEEKNKAYTSKKKPIKKNKGVTPPMEVDLHIAQLTANERGMTAHDKLNLQLDAARNKLEFAISKRIQRVVFIHGVGEGVLKAELDYLFSRYENLKYYDADFKKYGFGATEVYLFQNSY